MPLRNFDGDTFIAFIDISGFKDLMKNNERAFAALNTFYNSGYSALSIYGEVQGLFISDSGILIAPLNCEKGVSLELLLKVIREINRDMRSNGFMLTTSISYGKFTYRERIEFPGIEKNPIYGNGYVSAFLDNESGTPKIQPGQCRIIKENCPIDLGANENEGNTFSLVQKRLGDGQHYYFYWMLDSPADVETFERNYIDTYNLKYAGMLAALQGKYHGA